MMVVPRPLGERQPYARARPDVNVIPPKKSSLSRERRVIVRPSEVEFRFPSTRGARVIRVFIVGIPRIVAFSVSGTQILPLKISMRELEGLVSEARNLLSGGPIEV